MSKYPYKYLIYFLVSFIVLACKPGNANEKTNQIFCAVIRNDLKEIRYLIAHGADVNCRDVNDVTPLALSSRLGRGEISALLLDMGADANVQSKMNDDIGDGGYTPLLWTVINGDIQTLRLMLRKGGDVSKPSAEGDSPLIYAARSGFSDIVKFLFENGATRDYFNPYSGTTPLMEAVVSGHSQIVEYLIDKGMDIKQLDKNGNSLLMLASGRGRLVELMYFTEMGMDSNAKNAFGNTALHLAIGDYKNNLFAQKYLIKNGANIDAKNQDGITPLMEAAYRGYPQTVGLFIEGGGDINGTDNNGNTPLHYAAKGYKNGAEITLALIKSGAKINFINIEGNTPLIIASRYPNYDLVSALLGLKPEMNIQNKQGWTALMEAAKSGHLPIVKLLLEYGADVNQVNNEGKTAATIAKEFNHLKIYEYLKNLEAERLAG